MTFAALLLLLPLPTTVAAAKTLSPPVQAPSLPPWYVNNRIHAHSRMSIHSQCQLNATTHEWGCSDRFEDEAAHFAALGIKVFVRHTHSAGEGAWWPSSSGPAASWHPLVQSTGRNLPAEFLTAAAAANTSVIFYHYMMTNDYFATAHPEWVQRWPNGSAIEWSRGLGLSPCSDEWQDVYISQVLELVELGADGFYFDKYPASWGGDWSAPCRAKWAASVYPAHADEPMPMALTHAHNPMTHPVAADRRVQLLMSDVTEAYFTRLTSAIESAAVARGRSVALLVSVAEVPKADNGFGTAHRSGLFETTAMLSGAFTAAKTELHVPAALNWLRGDPVPTDVAMAFGFAMVRDAAATGSSSTFFCFDGHRPAHVWVSKIATEAQALHSSAALLTWGAVADLDIPDDGSTDPAVFASSFALSAALEPTLKRIGGSQPLQPLAWATVLFSEQARNQFLPDNAAAAWDGVLWPMLGAWGAMLQAMVPVQVRRSTLLPVCSARAPPNTAHPATPATDNRGLAAWAARGGPSHCPPAPPDPRARCAREAAARDAIGIAPVRGGRRHCA
jgi:hypothetical protein